jgi:uncharacterized protein (TIGR03066 family)
MPGGGARPAGGAPGGGARPGGGAPNRTPSFSPPAGARPGGGPGSGAGPGLTPGSRPSVGTRPAQPGGNRPQVGNLPSTRPDIGGRPGGSRPSQLPAVGAGAAAGAGLANRVGNGNRPGTLPGMGDGRPGASQLPNRTPEQRRDALQSRLSGERPGQQPARDWNQTRQDWQNQRNEIREDWQQHRDQARDDWQNWFDDHYGQYGGWYWGHAAGNWNRWDYMWDNYPVAAALGVTWWGANALGAAFGCGDYSNPYDSGGGEGFSYAEPIVSAPLEPVSQESGLPPGVSAEAVAKFDKARAAFAEGDYATALKLTDQAVAQMPKDAVLHEFRSLVLFALKRYPESAAAIHAVLAVGPGWDYPTLSSIYSDIDVYTTQLRALEAACKKNPKAADARFLLGYHYLTLGYTDEALAQFKKVVQLQPKDSVAPSLVATLSPRDAKPKEEEPAAAPKAVPAKQVVGNWTAAGERTAKYTMELQKDGTFKWAFTRGSRKQEVKGVYTVEGNVLAMEPDGGGVMLAELTARDETLEFKMIGDNADTKPLEFRRGTSN